MSVSLCLTALLIILSLPFPPSTGAPFSASQLPELPPLAIEKFSLASREAIQEAYKNVQRYPENAYLNGQLGMRMHAYEQYEFAEICYQRAHILDPKSFDWLYYLGTVQGWLGKKEESLANLREALKRNPNYLAGKVKFAEALFNTGKISDSIEVFEAVLKENPQSPLAHYGLGRALAANDQVNAAIEHFLKACDLYEFFGSAHYSLGLAYRDLGERKKAKEHFSAYKKNQNKWPGAGDFLLDSVQQLKTGAREHLARGVKLAKSDRIEEAIKEHEKALEIDPQMVRAHVHLIRLYGELSQFGKAELHYRKSVEINPNLPESHYNFGVLLSTLGRHKEAAEAFRKALEINPHFAHAHNNLGRMLESDGKLEEAVEHYLEALNNDPSYRLARFNLGRVLVAVGKNKEAVEQFSKILTPEDEKTPRFMYALAAAYARMGELEKALDYAQSAKQRATQLGQVQLAEQIEKDLQTLQKAVKPR